jgi:homoserine O-acetyltransferase
MYDGDGPTNGLSIARMLGHISFLSDEAFTMKFGRRLRNKAAFDYTFDTEFEVESYLSYQGDKFTKRFDANSLLYLTRAIDYYSCSSLTRATAEYLFVSYTTDWLYPTKQSVEMNRMAGDAGRTARHIEIDLPFGHDAFLLDGEFQGAELIQFLSD